MPFNPSVEYRGDRYLAAGVAGLGDKIGKMIEQVKSNAQEAQALRKLAPLYDPNLKDHVQTMSLGELRALAQKFAVEQHMQEQASVQSLRKAQEGNLAADNARSDENMRMLRDEYQRRKAHEEAAAGFNRSLGEGPPVGQSDFPGTGGDGSDPMARILHALRQFPAGAPQGLIQSLGLTAAQSADPNRQMVAEAKRDNAAAGLINAGKNGSAGLAEYRAKTLEFRQKQLDAGLRRDALKQAQADAQQLLFMPDGPEKVAAQAAIAERVKLLLEGAAPASGGPAAAPDAGGAPPFSLDDFNKWKEGRK